MEKFLNSLDGGKSALIHKGLKRYYGHIIDFLTLKYWFLRLKFALIPHILNLVWNFESFKCFISYEKPNVWAEKGIVWAEKEVLHLATTTAFYLFSPLKERILFYWSQSFTKLKYIFCHCTWKWSVKYLLCSYS